MRDGVRAGYGFIRTAWRGAFGALAVSAVASTFYLYADLAGLGRGALALSIVLALLAGVVSQGALLRLALKLDGLGPAGLQWKGLETRLLGLTLLTALLFALIALVLLIVILCIVLGLSMAGGGRAITDTADWISSLGVAGALVLLVVSLGGAAFIIWLSIRLCIAPVMTALAGRIQLLNTFDFTKGQVWPILGAMIMVALPVLAIGFVSGIFQSVGMSPPLALIQGVLSGLISAFVYAPAVVGLVAYLHERLVGREKA